MIPNRTKFAHIKPIFFTLTTKRLRWDLINVVLVALKYEEKKFHRAPPLLQPLRNVRWADGDLFVNAVLTLLLQ